MKKQGLIPGHTVIPNNETEMANHTRVITALHVFKCIQINNKLYYHDKLCRGDSQKTQQGSNEKTR